MLKEKNGVYQFDTVFELVQELDDTFGRENWISQRLGEVYVGSILVLLDHGFRFDPCTDEEYETYHHLSSLRYLEEFNIRLS